MGESPVNDDENEKKKTCFAHNPYMISQTSNIQLYQGYSVSLIQIRSFCVHTQELNEGARVIKQQ